MRIAKLCPESTEFDFVICDVLTGLLDLKNKKVVAIGISLMDDNVWKDRGCANLTIKRTASWKIEPLRMLEMTIILAIDVELRRNKFCNVTSQMMRERALSYVEIQKLRLAFDQTIYG